NVSKNGSENGSENEAANGDPKGGYDKETVKTTNDKNLSDRSSGGGAHEDEKNGSYSSSSCNGDIKCANLVMYGNEGKSSIMKNNFYEKCSCNYFMVSYKGKNLYGEKKGEYPCKLGSERGLEFSNGTKKEEKWHQYTRSNVGYKYYFKRKENRKEIYKNFVISFFRHLKRNLLTSNLGNMYDKTFFILEKLGLVYNYEYYASKKLCKLLLSNIFSKVRRDRIIFIFLLRNRNNHRHRCISCASFKKEHKRLLYTVCKLLMYFFLRIHYNSKNGGSLEGIQLANCLRNLHTIFRELCNVVTFLCTHKMFLLKSYICRSVYQDSLLDTLSMFKNYNILKHSQEDESVHNRDVSHNISFAYSSQVIRFDRWRNEGVKDYVYESTKKPRFISCEVYGAPPVTFKDDGLNDGFASKSEIRNRSEGGNSLSSNPNEKRECEEEIKKNISFI
ncbi:conserved protein, unknown function, partial [Plasmodium ovale]